MIPTHQQTPQNQFDPAAREHLLHSLLKHQRAVHASRRARRAVLAFALPALLISLATWWLYPRSQSSPHAIPTIASRPPAVPSLPTISQPTLASTAQPAVLITRIQTDPAISARLAAAPAPQFQIISDTELTSSLRSLDEPLGVIIGDQVVQLVAPASSSHSAPPSSRPSA